MSMVKAVPAYAPTPTTGAGPGTGAWPTGASAGAWETWTSAGAEGASCPNTVEIAFCPVDWPKNQLVETNAVNCNARVKAATKKIRRIHSAPCYVIGVCEAHSTGNMVLSSSVVYIAQLSGGIFR